MISYILHHSSTQKNTYFISWLSLSTWQTEKLAKFWKLRKNFPQKPRNWEIEETSIFYVYDFLSNKYDKSCRTFVYVRVYILLGKIYLPGTGEWEKLLENTLGAKVLGLRSNADREFIFAFGAGVVKVSVGVVKT